MLSHRLAHLALIGATALIVTGCSGGTGPEPDPADPPAVTDPPPAGLGDTACIVGTWNLDVGAYRAEAEGYLTGLGIPIFDFDMSGFQTLQFTEDGLLAVDTDLTSTGTIVAGDVSVPVNVRSAETASAEWGWNASAADSTGLVDIAEWQIVDVEAETAEEAVEAGVDFPPPRFDGESSTLLADCDADTLLLQGGGPLTALWNRG